MIYYHLPIHNKQSSTFIKQENAFIEEPLLRNQIRQPGAKPCLSLKQEKSGPYTLRFCPKHLETSEHPGRGRPRTALYVLLSDLSQEMQTLPSQSEGIRVHAVWEWKLYRREQRLL